MRTFFTVPAALLLLAMGTVARPAAAQVNTATINKLFNRFAGEVAGQLPVALLLDSCGVIGHGKCLQVLKGWSRQRKLHPLTAQAVDWARARQLRIAGRREEAARLIADLGYLTFWTHRSRSGEDIILGADPVSGGVDSAEYLELLPGTPHFFEVVIETVRESPAALRMDAPGLEQVCVADSCTAVEPFEARSFDQVVLPVDLHAGENPVTLHFSTDLVVSRFAVRLTRPDGKALALSCTGTTARCRVEGGRSKGSSALVPDALTWFEESADSEVLGRLAACVAARRAGRTDAPQLPSPEERAGLGSVEEWLLALECMQGREGQLQVLKEAQARHGDHPALKVAVAGYQFRTGHQWEAWRILTGLCPAGELECLSMPERAHAALLEREVMRQLSLTFVPAEMLADVVEQTAFTAGELVLALAEALTEEERYGEAAQALARYLEHSPGDYEVAATQMFLLEKMGDFKAELELVERLVWLYPTATYLSQTFADACLRAGLLEKAAKVYSMLESRGRHNAFVLERAADFFYAHGEKERAVGLWRRVQKLKPQERHRGELVAFLQSGHGTGEDETDIDEIRRLAQELPEEDARFAGALDRTRIRLFENRARRTRRVLAVKAIAPQPSHLFSFQFAYDSQEEEATVVRADILRADGTISPASDYGDVAVSEEEYNLFYDIRRMTVKFDDVQGGDILLVVYEIEAAAPILSVPFSGVYWPQDYYPKHNTSLEIIAPPAVVLHHHLGRAGQQLTVEESIEEKADGTSYSFAFGPLPKEVDEPFLPGRFERTSFIHYSTMEKWEDFVRWYAALIENEVRVSPQMRELVARSTEASEDRLSLTQALCRHVSDEVRYVGLEFGVHGLRPYPPAEVFQRGFGDCKDKSLLLVTLLREAGLKAHLVTVMTTPLGNASLHPGSPSLFDHAIVYLDEEERFYDPTARYIGIHSLPWQDQGAQALIVDKESPRQQITPTDDYLENRAEFVATVSPGMELAGTVRFTGQFAWQTLELLEYQGTWENTVESYLSAALPVVEVSSVEHEFVEEEPPVVTIRFSGVWKPGGDRVRVLPQVNSSMSVVQAAERKLPLTFAYPFHQEHTIEFQAGTFELDPADRASRECEDAAFAVVVNEEDGTLRLQVSFDQRGRVIPVERYKEYREVVHRFQETIMSLEGSVGN